MMQVQELLFDFADRLAPLLAARELRDYNALRLSANALRNAERVRLAQAKVPCHNPPPVLSDVPVFRRAKEGKVDWQKPGNRFVNPPTRPRRFGVLK